MKDFFVGLILCLDRSRLIQVPQIMKSKFFSEEAKYSFGKDSGSTSCRDSEINLITPQSEDLYIEVIEYAPKIFKKIRALEGITEDELIESLNPLNNGTIIKSQGKSDSFFLSTDDSKLVLKTLKKEEFDNLFNKFLYFYLHYLTNNSESLIARIYGVFKVKASYDADPLLIIVMRDAKGPMKNVI